MYVEHEVEVAYLVAVLAGEGIAEGSHQLIFLLQNQSQTLEQVVDRIHDLDARVEVDKFSVELGAVEFENWQQGVQPAAVELLISVLRDHEPKRALDLEHQVVCLLRLLACEPAVCVQEQLHEPGNVVLLDEEVLVEQEGVLAMDFVVIKVFLSESVDPVERASLELNMLEIN